MLYVALLYTMAMECNGMIHAVRDHYVLDADVICLNTISAFINRGFPYKGDAAI